MYNSTMYAPPVPVSRRALKQAARADLRAARPRVWKVTLVYLLLTSGLLLLLNLLLGDAASTAQLLQLLLSSGTPEELYLLLNSSQSAVPAALSFFLQVLLQLYTVILSFGYCVYTLRRTRGEAAGFGDLLTGFGMTGRVIVMNLIVFAFSLCWSFLVMIPVTMAATFLMTFLLSTALMNPAAASADQVLSQMLVLYPVLLVVVVAAALLILFLTLRYVLSPFCLADRPDDGPLAAVRSSRTLLYNRHGEIFKLALSFLGWELLGGLAAGLVTGLCAGLGMFLFLSGGSTAALVGCVTAGQVLGFLLPLPLTIWVKEYYMTTLARYYAAILPAGAGDVQPLSGQNGPAL